jgi:hypothetical protein
MDGTEEDHLFLTYIGLPTISYFNLCRGYPMSSSENDCRFYVYVYLDPRKPGKYVYDGVNVCFLYEPFYVGKGTGKRIKNHFKPTVLNDGTFKSNVFKKILEDSQRPIPLKLFNDINDQQSKDAEVKLIKEIGRIKLGTGPLTNLTDGGDGSYGFKHTEESRSKIGNRYYPKGSEHFGYGKLIAPDVIEKMRETKRKNGTLQLKHSEETKRKISESEKGEKHYLYNKGYLVSGSQNPFYGKKHSKETRDKNIIYKWDFVSPDGTEYNNIIYLREFCDENGLNLNSVYNAAWKNKPLYGWKIFRKKKEDSL